MKYRALSVWVVLSLVFISNGLAAEKRSALVSDAEEPVAAAAKPAPVAKPAEVKPPTAEELKALKKMREGIEVKKKDLNGTKWTVNVTSNDPKLKGATDVVIFENGTISLESLAKRGFPATNYTITIPSAEGAGGVYETMQTDGKGGTIFIRGEWNKNVMQGTVNERLDDGKVSRDWWFTSSARTVIADDKKGEDKDAKSPAREEAPKSLISQEDESSIAPEQPEAVETTDEEDDGSVVTEQPPDEPTTIEAVESKTTDPEGRRSWF